MRHPAAFIVIASTLAAGCSADGTPTEVEAYAKHGETSDFDPVADLVGKDDAVAETFDRNRIVGDAFFTDADALAADEIQRFLEATPYDGTSWLAEHRVDGRPVADVLADAARRHQINPMMILSRFQVEGSHVSTSTYPGDFAADRSLGCGCFDGEACRSSYLGVDNQIECAATTLRQRFDGSVDESWEWRRGVAKTTLDGLRVVPSNHGTASLYAYTPWVLRGRGGNWLVWNVTKKFVAHAPHSLDGSDSTSSLAEWVGKPCASDVDCDFAASGGNFGFCYDFVDGSSGQPAGFCALTCAGGCPDHPEAAGTFCIEADVAGTGICASKSEAVNDFCAQIPGTVETEVERFVGDSGVNAATATVCAPNAAL